MSFQQQKISFVNINNFQMKLDQSESSIQSVVNAVSFIYKFATKSKLDEKDLATQLKSGAILNDDAIAVIKHVWKDHGKSLIDASTILQRSISAGKLVDFKWKLGLAMTSDTCKNLNSPYVVISLKVADSAGRVTNKSFELTVPEFQNFSKELKNMSNVMETV
ncbi:COMM domain-containing protein 6-like isoform X2 [Tubulanus polymorphus]